MDLILKRIEKGPRGVFGCLLDENDDLVAVTAEHAYRQDDGSWEPKVPTGLYVCRLGTHRLSGMSENFETYEISGVSGHTNILFHVGNWPQKDSDGCVLIGHSRDKGAIVQSRVTFEKFMRYQNGVDSFHLLVIEDENGV